MLQSEIILLDTETTELGPDARLVQLAYKNLKTGEIFDGLFRPIVPIGFEAMAVHHVTQEMVEDKESFAQSDARIKLKELIDRGAIIVAHNAKFDLNILKNEGINVDRFICTQKVSRHVIDVESYKLQYLRYAVLKNKNMENIGMAHNALADILVLEQLFNYLLLQAPEQSDAVIETMIDLSQKPVLLKKVAFGKYNGMKFDMLVGTDRGYLRWMFSNAELMKDEDLKYTVDYYLSAR